MKLNLKNLISGILTLSLLISVTVYAENENRINSKGKINFKNTQINGDEIVDINDNFIETMNIVSNYKSKFLSNVIINNNNNNKEISFNSLSNNILNSQNIINYISIDSDCVSLNKAGWVGGKIIIGNGISNQNNYNNGKEKGEQDGANKTPNINCNINNIYHHHIAPDGTINDNFPVYNVNYIGGCFTQPVYHQHIGDSQNGGGCYTVPVTHVHSSNCYRKVYCNNEYTYYNGDHWVTDYHADCPVCGRDVVTHWSPGYGSCYNCILCGKNSGGVYYDLGCGKSNTTLEGYTVGCGKISGVTIDSISLKFQ